MCPREYEVSFVGFIADTDSPRAAAEQAWLQVRASPGPVATVRDRHTGAEVDVDLLDEEGETSAYQQ